MSQILKTLILLLASIKLISIGVNGLRYHQFQYLDKTYTGKPALFINLFMLVAAISLFLAVASLLLS